MTRVRLIVCGLLLTLVLNPLTSIPAEAFLAPAGPTIVYVDQSATGENDGSSWTDAYTNLYTALLIATSNMQIRVAQGTHKPGILRTHKFQLKNNVVLYGGFPMGGSTPDERDPVAYPTILSGDLGNDDDPTNNNYHVVTGSGTDASAILDGFTVTGGYADGSNPHGDGAGMLNIGGHPTVRNVVFERNTATGFGGGMENLSSSPTLVNVTFRGNRAHNYDGGGLDNFEGSSPTLFNVVFSGNAAGRYGGGMNNDTTAGEPGSDPHLTNATFAGNTAGTAGDAVRNTDRCQATLVNSILWKNDEYPVDDCATCNSEIRYSIVQGGCPANANCTNLISGKPLFIEDPDPGGDGVWGTDDDEYGDLRLNHGSDALDAGDDSAIGESSSDLMGNPRPFDLAEVPDGPGGYVDLGAYEAPPSRLYVDRSALGADTGLTWSDAFGDLLDALTWSRS
ncbi:choice-of-anchor Q domain-containing protein, partial [Chloroflexota bacterium]